MAESSPQRNERRARTEFEAWAKEGSRPCFYPLDQCANGEYVSLYTEFVWKAFFAGWNAK
jgi:hypothetical protein